MEISTFMELSDSERAAQLKKEYNAMHRYKGWVEAHQSEEKLERYKQIRREASARYYQKNKEKIQAKAKAKGKSS